MKIFTACLQIKIFRTSISSKNCLKNFVEYSYLLIRSFKIYYDARVTLKTYSLFFKHANKFLVLPGHHNGYGLQFKLEYFCLRQFFTETFCQIFFDPILLTTKSRLFQTLMLSGDFTLKLI
jgi:hypothetical protein